MRSNLGKVRIIHSIERERERDRVIETSSIDVSNIHAVSIWCFLARELYRARPTVGFSFALGIHWLSKSRFDPMPAYMCSMEINAIASIGLGHDSVGVCVGLRPVVRRAMTFPFFTSTPSKGDDSNDVQ